MVAALHSGVRCFSVAAAHFPKNEHLALRVLSSPATDFVDPWKIGSVGNFLGMGLGTLEQIQNCVQRTLEEYRDSYIRAEQKSRNPKSGALSHARAQHLSSRCYEINPLAFYQAVQKSQKVAFELGVLYVNYAAQAPERQQAIKGLFHVYGDVKLRAGFFADAYSYSGAHLHRLLQAYKNASTNNGLSDITLGLAMQILEEFGRVVSLHGRDRIDKRLNLIAELKEKLMDALEAFAYDGVSFPEHMETYMDVIAYKEGVSLKRDLLSESDAMELPYFVEAVRRLAEHILQAVSARKIGLPLI